MKSLLALRGHDGCRNALGTPRARVLRWLFGLVLLSCVEVEVPEYIDAPEWDPDIAPEAALPRVPPPTPEPTPRTPAETGLYVGLGQPPEMDTSALESAGPGVTFPGAFVLRDMVRRQRLYLEAWSAQEQTWPSPEASEAEVQRAELKRQIIGE